MTAYAFGFHVGRQIGHEKTAGLFSPVARLFGNAASRAGAGAAAGTGTAVASAASKALDPATVHPSVLAALSAARKINVPQSRVADQADWLFNRSKLMPGFPRAPTFRPRSTGQFARFGDTEAAKLSLNNAMQRFNKATGRPAGEGVYRPWAELGDQQKAPPAATWGQLKGIVPGGGQPA